MSQKPMWISHRGYSEKYDENSRDAFDSAIDLGFLHLETDLRMTSDGHIVLCHDRSLERIAGLTKNVDDMPREYLEQVILNKGGSMMFFDEFIERYPACNWTFDIKPESGAMVLETFAAWLNSVNAHRWIQSQARFLMWNEGHERRLTEFLPDASIYANQKQCWRAGVAVLSGLPRLAGFHASRVYAIPEMLGPLELFKRKYVDRYHAMGVRVCAFLPHDKEASMRAIDAGFDEILTNGAIYTSPVIN